MLSSAIVRLFIFAFATSTVTSALLSAEISRNVVNLTGSALELLNFDAAPEMLTEIYTSLLRTITVKPVEAAIYQEALKAIVGQTYFDQRQELATVNAAIQAIEDELFKELIANADDVKDKLAGAVPKVVELMKAGLIDSLRAQASGLKQNLDYSDRVSNLKNKLKSRLVNEYVNQQIDGTKLKEALEKLDAGILNDNPEVKALLKAYNDNSLFLLHPGSSFEAVVKAQIGSVEAGPETLRNTPLSVTNKIKETISIWLSSPMNLNPGLNFVRVLACDIKEIENNPTQVFGQETKVDDVNDARAFLTDLMGHVFSTTIAISGEFINTDAYKQLINTAFKTAVNYFGTRVFEYPGTNLSALVQKFYTKELTSSFNLKEDTKFVAFRKLQKYTGVIVVVNASSALTEADKKDFINNFSIFADLTTTEVAALNIMQGYLANSSIINYADNEAIFGLMLAEFAQFLAGTDQSDLVKKTAYKRFDAYLVGKIADSTGTAKLFYVVLRLVNFLQSGNKSADVSIDPLDQDGQEVLAEQFNSGLFDGAYKQFLVVIINRNVHKSNALIHQKNNSRDVNERENLKQEIQKLNDQEKLDSAILSQKTLPTPEQLADIRKRILEVITPGYTFLASKEFLI